MHYFKFNIGEYASHTRHLSPLEDIAYRRLLDLAYTSELPLIKDIRQLTRLINMREHEIEVQDILREFFFEADEGWLNNRVIKEIKATGEKSDAAKNSAAMRWDSERKAKKMQEQCDHDANALNNDANACKNDATNNPLPITNNQLPNTNDPLPNTKKSSEVITIVEVSEIVSAEKTSAPNKKGKSLDKDWQLPKQWGDWAMLEKPELSAEKVRKIAENFKDHWCANANQANAKKADWEAAWRNWVRRQRPESTGFQTAGERRAANNKRAGDEFMMGSEIIIEGDFYNA